MIRPRSILLGLIFLSALSLAGSALAGTLSCTTGTSCSGGTVLMKMSSTTNAHAELNTQSNYTQLVCCTGVSGLGTSCSGTFATVGKLSGTTNAHFEQNTASNYANSFCLSVGSGGSVSIGYQATSCTGFDTTLFAVSAATTTNLHVGDGSPYTNFVCGTAAAAAPPPAPPPAGGGGAGGGGGGAVSTGTAVFSGHAYPQSTVTLLKDAQVSATTVAQSDATFSLALTGLSAGNYIFAMYSEDKAGRRSALLTFPVSVTAGATTNVSGIFIAPTIDVDKQQVKRGDDISIFGQSVPQSDIVISVNSPDEFFARAIADKDGAYLYHFDSAVLEYGAHTTKSKSSVGNQLVSGYSNAVNFSVGTTNIIKVAPKLLRGDLNKDGRVNLIDFSIAAFWYKRILSETFKAIELERLNGDGKITLTDFSIMAYYWTG